MLAVCLLLPLLIHATLQANFTLYTFQEWKGHFNINYPNATEDAWRENCYNANLAKLINSSCDTCAITKFAADTPDEIAGS